MEDGLRFVLGVPNRLHSFDEISSVLRMSQRGGSQRRRDPYRKVPLYLWGFVAVLVVGLLTALPAYRWTKQVRGRRLAREAEALMTQKKPDFNLALQKIRVAVMIAPKEPVVLRATAHLQSRLGQNDALTYWTLLLAGPEATDADRDEFLKVAMEMNWLEAAGEELARRLRTNPKDVASTILWSKLVARQLNATRAEQLARRALQLDPQSDEARVWLGEILVQHADAARRREGRTLLWPIAIAAAGEHRGRAREILAASREISGGEAAVLIRSFRTGQPGHRDELWAATIEWRQPGADHAALVQALMKKFGDSRDPEVLGAVSGWLMTHGEGVPALELLRSPVTETNMALANQRLATLHQLRRWDELQPLLEAPASAADPVYRLSIRGVKAAHEGRGDDAEKDLTAAAAQARGSSAKLILVAQLAEMGGRTNLAMKVWSAVASHPPSIIRAIANILRLERSLKNPKLLAQTLEQLAAQVPSDPSVAGRHAYYSILLNDQVNRHRQRIAEMLAKHPGNLELRVAAALGEIVGGRGAAALAFFEHESVRVDALDERATAVYVTALGASDQREAARLAGRRVNLELLNDLEQQLVKPWL